jgi:hypothetical protein
LRIGLGNQQFIMRADTASLSRRLSYTGNLGSSFTKHSVVDKNYVDSSITASPSGTVTSVGLSMPTAFVVTNSPVISSGTLTVTGAGVASQYIRGDGQLATLPTTGGGGSSVSYYLNGSVNQGTFGGTPYYEMSKTAIFGAGTDFTISSNGYIASFITDAGDPALLNIPAGNWDFEVYFQSSSASGTPSFYVELYKYDGTTFTLIASSSANPKFITGGTSVDAYYTPLAVPSTSLLVTDRLAVRIYVNNSGNTITLHTEDNNLCQIITTFSTGINALNGLTSQVQYFATGTSGTDFNINSATDTHTFNLPTASATNRGALSSADWSTFNSKIGPSDTSTMLSPYLRKVDTTAMLSPYKTFYPRTAISLTTTGSSGAATYDNSTGVLNIPQYTDQFTGTVTSVATNTATGITGGTITTTGTLAIDTNLISTRAWRQKGIDSVASLPKVTSVATNTSTGITGGTITSTGTLAIDTLLISTRAWRQKGIDSVASLANSKIGGSGTTNYVSKFTASGTIGNSQIFDNGTSVGVNTASPSASYKLDVNGTTRVQGGSSVPLTSLTSNFDVANFFGSAAYAGFRIVAPTSGGSVPYIGLNTSSNVAGYNVGLQKAFFAYWGDIVNYASIGYGSGSHAMVYSVVSGNVIFGGGTTDAGYKVDIGGTTRISGTELRLDNGTTGTINLYSATPSIQFFSGDPTGYRLFRSGTRITLNSGGSTELQISGNSAYTLDATNGHIWRTATSGGAALARLTTGGNFMVGTTTDVSSAILQLSSTTKGFLPPVMTGAQAELIGTPATGLMVYANNGNGATITSTGWWGYNGTTWVKLN